MRIKIDTHVAPHVTRTSISRSKVKALGHQAALVGCTGRHGHTVINMRT